MDKRIKALEVEVSYLRKELEELKNERPVEIHTHHHYDYSNMKPVIIKDIKGLKKFNNDLDELM